MQTLKATGSIVGLVDGFARAMQHIVQGFSGALSDRLQKRKGIALAGYLTAAFHGLARRLWRTVAEPDWRGHPLPAARCAHRVPSWAAALRNMRRSIWNALLELPSPNKAVVAKTIDFITAHHRRLYLLA
jgi:hypothetical protein